MKPITLTDTGLPWNEYSKGCWMNPFRTTTSFAKFGMKMLLPTGQSSSRSFSG